MRPVTVVKVGGSLYDLPDLGPRLRRWLGDLGATDAVLVPGGGATADAVRGFHHVHGLDKQRAHWLALLGLALNAHFLAWLAGRGLVAAGPEGCRDAWAANCIPVLDLHAFARADEGRPGRLPASWRVTSDALAARAAAVLGARRLVLLKSVTVPKGMSWEEAARHGYVDPAFAGAVTTVPGLEVRTVNFRSAAT
jgi:aspartokinase-like uncharacterized kinase